MSQTSRCRECSAELPAGEVEELCPQCLAALRARETAFAPADPSAPVSDLDDEFGDPLPRDLGAVRVDREIGRGAIGIVYRGHDTVLGRDVAVKFLTIGGRDHPAVARFLDEARCAAAVRHPNLTQIYHAEFATDAPYLVMELINGPSLRQLLGDCGPMPLAPALLILQEICAAVTELHDRRIVHRDLKPANVLIEASGRVVVTDFGLALLRPARTGASAAEPAGSPAYMAPEAFDGHVSARSDIYALGILAYELLTGTIPFTGTIDEVIDKHRQAPLPTEALLSAGIPPAVIEVIDRAAGKQAVFRYKSPRDFIRAMKDAAVDAAKSSRASNELTAWLNRSREPAEKDLTPPLPGSSSGASPLGSSSASLPGTLGQIVARKRQLRSKNEPLAAVALVAPVPLAQTASNCIAIDLPCVGCGSNLRSVAANSICPGCGRAVAPSLDRKRVVFGDPDWVRRICLGLVLLAIAPIILLAFGIIDARIGLGLGALCAIGGVVLATSSRPGMTGGFDTPRLCRWVLATGLEIVAALALLAWIKWPYAAVLPGPAAALLECCLGLILIAPLALLLQHVGTLTASIPESPICRHTRRAAFWALVIASVVGVASRTGSSGIARTIALVVAILAVAAIAISLFVSRRELKRVAGVSHESLFRL